MKNQNRHLLETQRKMHCESIRIREHLSDHFPSWHWIHVPNDLVFSNISVSLLLATDAGSNKKPSQDNTPHNVCISIKLQWYFANHRLLLLSIASVTFRIADYYLSDDGNLDTMKTVYQNSISNFLPWKLSEHFKMLRKEEAATLDVETV